MNEMQEKTVMNEMQRDFVVTFLNVETNKVGHDCFTACSESDARSQFRACYRHHVYRILSTVATGRW